MVIITLAQTKALLGLSDTEYDAQISAMIPFIDAKVKLITRNNWNKRIYGDITDGSDYITVYEDYTLSNKSYGYILDWIQAGSQIYGTGIPTGVYIVDIFNEGTEDNENYPLVQINDDCTANTTGLEIFIGFPIAYLDVVAKGIWFMIGGTSTNLPGNTLASRSFGALSVSFADGDQKLDKTYGMPSWFVKGLPRYHGGI